MHSKKLTTYRVVQKVRLATLFDFLVMAKKINAESANSTKAEMTTKSDARFESRFSD